MKTITAQDIRQMIQEKLQVFAGKGKNKKIIISRNFKIVHLASGLTYTVDDVKIVKGKPVILAHSGDGEMIQIRSKEFNQYKGL